MAAPLSVDIVNSITPLNLNTINTPVKVKPARRKLQTENSINQHACTGTGKHEGTNDVKLMLVGLANAHVYTCTCGLGKTARYRAHLGQS